MGNITLAVPSGTGQVSAPGGPYAVGTDTTVSVPTSLILPMLGAGCTYLTQNSDMVFLQAPAAADLVSIVAAASPTTGVAMTIAAQPDVPRKLQVRGVYSGAVAGLVVNLVGTDARGNAITETVNVAAASSTTFTTVNAYAHVTSVTPVGTTTNVTTIGVGVSAAVALILSPAFVDLVVYKESVSAGTATFTDEAVGTVDTVAGTVSPTTAPNGTKSFKFWYTWNTVNI